MQCAQIHTKAKNKQTKSNKPIEVHNKTGKCPFFGGTNWQIRSNRPFSFCFFYTKKKKNKSVPSTKHKHTLLHIFHTQNKLVEKKSLLFKNSPKSLEKSDGYKTTY